MPADLQQLQQAFRSGKYRPSVHAFVRMFERAVSLDEIAQALGQNWPEVIEDYPQDPQGPSCLILGWTRANRPLHVQVGYGGHMATVVTIYEPDPSRWEDFRRRR